MYLYYMSIRNSEDFLFEKGNNVTFRNESTVHKSLYKIDTNMYNYNGLIVFDSKEQAILCHVAGAIYMLSVSAN